MKDEIKKGDMFLCICDYYMDDDSIAYTKGKTYISELDGCITDDGNDIYHGMELDSEFWKHFIRKQKENWIKYEEEVKSYDLNCLDIVYTDKENMYPYVVFCNFSSIYEKEKITHILKIDKPNPPIN